MLNKKFAANGIMLDNKKIFMIKRGPTAPAFPNHWACPGGICVAGETPEETARREVKEEAGLNFEAEELFFVSKLHLDLYHFIGSFNCQLIKDDREVAGCKWLSYDEAKSLPLAFDYIEIVERLRIVGKL